MAELLFPRTVERERAREGARWAARPGEGERVLRPRNITLVMLVVGELICSVYVLLVSFLLIGAAHWQELLIG